MQRLLKSFWLVALALVAMLLPGLAAAADGRLSPPGATDWTLYVYGNGRVIYDIMMGIKMLMMPTAGNTGFVSLLLVLATIGFVVLAIAAGFDPGKNLFRMFTYILVVWFVTYGTTRLSANVVIEDLARDNTTGSSSMDLNRVSGAPALVVLPAALTSTVGKYFTQAIETYFTTASEFKISGQAAGQFNLFGKMMQEANQFQITNPGLKKTLSAYAANCVVPGIALGQVGAVNSATGQSWQGTEALLKSPDMMPVLKSAQNKSLLTKYYPYSVSDNKWMDTAKTELPTTDPSASKAYSSMGALVSCETAYTLLAADMDAHAKELMQANANAWAKTGVLVPFEAAMSDMLASVSARGSEGAGFSSPNGFIMQQALINSQAGAYRQAAMQTGNNELLQAATLAQAEVNQKSTWASSFVVFNNMMGYVFTVLQAFIFAVTPLIIVALFIPGMGKAIFVNYAQILVWLTLWQPMLSLINFIITLFGQDSIGGVIGGAGGLTMENSGVISVKTNDLMIAAQFLGTMTPLLSWGIVKGAMAFTEFISHGVGSSFASQAGAAAASGNLNMNNMSMDNTSMNSFSTQMSSKVGFQAVSAGANAGGMTTQQDAGGSSARANDAGINAAAQASKQLSSSISESKAIGEQLNAMKEQGVSDSQLEQWARERGTNSARSKAAQMVLDAKKSASEGGGAGTTRTASDTAGTSESGGAKDSTGITSRAGIKGDIGVKTPVGGLSFGGGADTSASQDNSRSSDGSVGHNANLTRSADEMKRSVGEGVGEGNSFSSGSSVSSTASDRHGLSRDQGTTNREAVSEAISRNTAITESLSAAQSVTESLGYNQGMSLQSFEAQLHQIESMRSSMAGGIGDIQNRAEGLASSLTGRSDAVHSAFAARRAGHAGGFSGMGGGGAYAPGNFDSGVAGIRDRMGQIGAAVKADQGAVAAQHGSTTAGAQKRVDTHQVTNGNIMRGGDTVAPGQLGSKPQGDSAVDFVGKQLSRIGM